MCGTQNKAGHNTANRRGARQFRHQPTVLNTSLVEHRLGVDPEQTSTASRPFDQLLSDTAGGPALHDGRLTLFGLAALALADVGIYGAIAVATGQRTRDIGQRLAMGAQRAWSGWSWAAPSAWREQASPAVCWRPCWPRARWCRCSSRSLADRSHHAGGRVPRIVAGGRRGCGRARAPGGPRGPLAALRIE